MRQRVILSAYSIFITLTALAALVALMIVQLNKGEDTMAYFIAGALILICVLALIYAPLSISVDDENVNINRSLRIKSIPIADIAAVYLCQPTMSERRICGSGGWFGYWGWFKEPSIGRYFAYYGKSSDCFLVQLKDGRQYLLGCKYPADVVEFINNSIVSRHLGNQSL